MPSGEKTEAPTPKRRNDERKKGNVPKSTELNAVLAFLAAVLVLKSIGANVLAQILDLLTGSFRNLASGEWTVSGISSYGAELGILYLGMMAPLFIVVVMVGIASNAIQAGVLLTTKPLSPDFSRVDPFKGLKRMFSQRSLVEGVKSIVRVGIVGYIAYATFQERYLQVVSLTSADIRGAAGVIVDLAMEVLMKCGFALLVLAALDYGYQRWEHERKLRMTKQELKEEMRESEGDPKIKSKIRQQQRQMAARRMMHDVLTSDVVITNPTHLAVALQYRPESMHSPRVLAKGQLLVAEMIKEIARKHGIPIIENKPLAQALYKTVEVGSEIPPALYHAVAEILAFIYSLKRRKLGGQGIGS